MNNSMRKDRPTYTDKLMNSTSWVEVLDLVDDNSFFVPVYLGKELERLPDPEYEPEDPESRVRFESLSDIIDNLLAKDELKIWNLVVNEKYSYRKVGEELSISHESARKIFKAVRLKISEAYEGVKDE